MTLRADDGTLLQTKDPIVLSPDGEQIFDASKQSQDETADSFHKFRVLKFSGGWSPLIVLVAGGVLALGAVFIGGFLAILLALWLVRLALRSLGLRV